ncbi:deleted in malignant brain tumors 1 protein-like isoform X3 [Actinia tenebrosa]|uniref:Deleted in malignant brain tumors 1 protein-like isoform X3 n=1 Tax=Actinia tenebrosa TaxID=6105 RepID=A0A6P8IHG8_ACTTE|nr:deleted in malignant brain tumors 1 protein-like isoform X3 [Actinia tenebrosa]
MDHFKLFFAFLSLIPSISFLDASNIRLRPDTRGYVWGVIQVYHNGQWGTVCYDSWDWNEAHVACRQLGFTKAVNYDYDGRGEGPVWLDDMACTGSEASLQDCSHPGWEVVNSHCNSHTNDAVVECSGYTGNAASNIRLLGVSGIVQVYHGGKWGTVCDDSWGWDDAKVACRQLGFIKTVYPWCCGHGEQGKVWLDDMVCTGSEASLKDCPHAGWGVVSSYCNNHNDDAVVQCSGSQVRLQGGTYENEGRVEIKYGTWGNICSNGFGTNEANVVCKMLGYQGAITAKSYDQLSYTAWLKDVSCHGNENSTDECTHSSFASQSCPNSKIAGVVCYAKKGHMHTLLKQDTNSKHSFI